MRRWLAIVLLALLPLQFSWAAAAAYCGHESTPASIHIGHHDHQHKGVDADGSKALAQDAAASDASQSGDHADCGFCHLSCAKTVVSYVRMPRAPASDPEALFAPRSYVSHLRGRIERPNWQPAA
jgi:hypothetical protein